MVGTTISHYKVLEKIGQGGMGEVYRVPFARMLRSGPIRFSLSSKTSRTSLAP